MADNRAGVRGGGAGGAGGGAGGADNNDAGIRGAANWRRLADFLHSQDRCVIASQANCAVVLYAFYPPDILLFISHPKSIHASSLAQHNHANFAIYESEILRGISGQMSIQQASEEQRRCYLARYKMAQFAREHQIYAAQIVYAKFKQLIPPKRWEYGTFRPNWLLAR